MLDTVWLAVLALFFFCFSSLFLCFGGAAVRGVGNWLSLAWLTAVGDRIWYILKSSAVLQDNGTPLPWPFVPHEAG